MLEKKVGDEVIPQAANLTVQREQLYAQAFNLPVASSNPNVLSFEQKVKNMHVMTLSSDWHCWIKTGDIVLPKGSAVFCDESNRPRLTDVGWDIYRSFGPLAHNHYPVIPGDPVNAIHVMANKYPWPSEDVVTSSVRLKTGTHRSFMGKLWHWLKVGK